MFMVFSCLGLIGGLLCCTGDILFDLKGAGNEKLGTSKNIDSNWVKMADWRFGLSIALAMIGDALVGLRLCTFISSFFFSAHFPCSTCFISSSDAFFREYVSKAASFGSCISMLFLLAMRTSPCFMQSSYT